jgi:uncharacterized integral membrane protein
MIPIHTKDKVKLGLLIAVALYFLILLLSNMEPAKIDFLFFQIQMPVFFLILFSAVVGAGLVLGFSTLKSLRRPRDESKPADAAPK